MGFRRRATEPAAVRPDRPDNIFGLVYELTGDPARARCFMAIASVVFLGTALIVFAATFAVALALPPARQIRGVSPGYLVAAIWAAASLITGTITTTRWMWRRRTLRNSRAGSASGGIPTGRN